MEDALDAPGEVFEEGGSSKENASVAGSVLTKEITGNKKVASVILATDQQPCSSETILFERTISKDSQNEDKIKVRVLNPTKIRALIHKREQLRLQIRELEDRELDFDDPEKEDRLIGHEIEMKKAIIEVEETLKRAGVLLYKQKEEEGEEHEDFKIVLTGTGIQALDDRLNAFLAKRDLQNASEVWLSSEQIHQLMVEQYEADHSSDRTVRVPAPNTDDFTKLFLHVCDRVLPKLRTIRISMLQSYLEEDHLKSKGIAVEPPVLPSYAPLTKLSDAMLTYEETLKHICSNDSQEAEPESADECDKGDEEYMEERDGVGDAEGTKTAENESCSENSQDDLHDNGHQLDSSESPLCLNMYEKNQYEVTKDVMQKIESQMEKDEPKSAPYSDEKEDSEEDCDIVFVCEQYAEVNEQSETIEKEQIDEATHDGDMCKVVYETTDDNESATDVPKYVEVEAMEEEEDKEADSSVTPPINPLSVAPKSELTSIRDHSVREMEEDKSTLPASPSPPIFSGPSKIEYHEVNKFDEPIELYQPKQVVPAYEADDDEILFIEVVKGHGPAYETDVGIVNTAKNDYVWKWLTEKFFLPEEIAVVDIADSDDEAILSQGEARTEKFRLSMNSEEKQLQKRPEEDNSVDIAPKKARFCGGNDGQLL